MTETTNVLPFLPEPAAAPLGGTDPGWLADLRRAGLAVYRERGLPTVKVEAWKYTGLAGLKKTPFALDDGTLPTPPEGAAGALDLADAITVTLVNGRLVTPPSGLPEGVRVDGLARLLDEDPAVLEPHMGRIADLSSAPMGSLNAALMADGLVLRIAPGAILETALHVISITDAPDGARHMHPRHLIVMGEGASATVIESRVTAEGANETLCNALTEIRLGAGARLRHARLVRSGPRAVDLDLTAVDAAAGAAYEAFTLTLAGRLVRNEGHVRLGGARASARLHGAYGAGDAQHLDTTLVVDHAVPDTTSDQRFKGVVDAGGRGVFQGKVIVRRDAQRSDGNQLHKALLLDRAAEVYTKPELEIYADDVKCSHGATVGDLDGDQLFYLMSRGIPEAQARALLVEAFLDDVVALVPAGPTRTAFLEAVRAWLTSRQGGCS